MFKLRPYQQHLVDENRRLWSEGVKNPCTVLPTGGGKCHRKGTKILMFDGTIRNVEDVVVGDQLMGPDSTPRNVIALGRGSEMMYEIQPVKGEPYFVNESHILSLRMTEFKGMLKAGNGIKYGAGEIANISVLDYLASSKSFKHCAKGWRVEVEFGDKPLHPQLPPYMLGIWLGDGSSRTSSITTADPEVIQYIIEYCTETKQDVRVEFQENNASDMYHIKNGNRRDGFGLIGGLRTYDLVMNKHIPHDYLCNSRANRLELLAGILDSDGYLHHGHYDVVFKVKQLAHDLAYLARSLGFSAYVNECQKTCTNTGATSTYHRLSISGGVSLIPTRLGRHKAPKRRQIKNVLRTGIRSVKPVGIEPYYGFEIDSDHLYLLGDFTVTHNTVVAAELIRQEQAAGGYFAAIAHRQELVGQISLALARQGVLHNIVAPRPVVKFCSNLHSEELGRSFYSPTAPGFVGGVNTVIRRDMSKIKDTVSLVFQDECFPAGTLISMADGTQKPIEDITVGDRVKAFNEKNGDIVHRSVEHLYCNPAPEKLVRIETYDGDLLLCTGNHPIWVSRRKRGCVTNSPRWIDAVQLIGGQIAAMCQEMLVNGRWKRIKSARYTSHKFDTVYNFAVEELHTYVANGVVVHNCHHVLADNLWGKAASLFPRANGLYVTATPLRADGKGLGRHADGIFDEFIFGPPMRQLIREGSLTDYRIYAPPSDIDLTAMKFGSDGDYSRPELVKRAKKSGIVGDVVSNYEKYCQGVQTVVFVVDVEQAHEVANKLNDCGIKAVALSANNSDAERQEAIGAFKRKEIQVIVNVDLLGEGFDCPAIECVIMARPTMSYGLYVQMFGRAIRILAGKQYGLIIDMVGNVKRHGLPDAPREWSLDRREKRSGGNSGDLTTKTCSDCLAVYAVGPSRCPFCGGNAPTPGASGRGDLVVVDADLRELSPEELAELRGEADKLDREWTVPYGGSKTQMMAAISHNKTVKAQRELREAIALYAGAFRSMGCTDEMIHVQMVRTYGVNNARALTLRPKDAEALRGRILTDLKELGVMV